LADRYDDGHGRASDVLDEQAKVARSCGKKLPPAYLIPAILKRISSRVATERLR